MRGCPKRTKRHSERSEPARLIRIQKGRRGICLYESDSSPAWSFDSSRWKTTGLAQDGGTQNDLLDSGEENRSVFWRSSVNRGTINGRGVSTNPKNRFEMIAAEKAPADFAEYFEDPEEGRNILTKFYVDHSHSILAKNDSPDLGFTYSLNPYRGCEHGCIYCYARPTHEYLGFSSGLDFETKIMVKPDAAALLDEQLNRPSWQPQMVMLSGDTDCYQPIEKKLQITRQCLEIFLEHRNPVSIVTKNALIQRDLDILKELASMNLVVVTISITSLNHDLIRKMEPRTSIPAKRLETVKVLSENGIPVGVNACPIIPGLNDVEIPSILEESANRGARSASYTIVRLPHVVKDLFVEWVQRELPDRAPAILNRIRDIRGGNLSCSGFGVRL